MESGIESYILELIVLVIGAVFLKWVKPLLTTAKKKKMAELIAQIADDITDELVVKYPDEKLWHYLNEGVDKVIETCKLKDNAKGRNVAARATVAAMARKGKTVPAQRIR